jgi:hypothetical protein
MKPGVKPTMSGIHTGHPSAALVIRRNQNLSYLNPSRTLKFNMDLNQIEVDWTGFEPMTPRVQGGYTTRLYYQPTLRQSLLWILIVVLSIRNLFEQEVLPSWFF